MASRYLTRGKFPTPLDREAVARKWRGHGYSCGALVDPPGRAWEGYVHDVDELACVIEGRLAIEVAGESFAVEPGDEVFIPAHAVHSVRNVHPGATRWLYGYGRGADASGPMNSQSSSRR